jgi:lysophospholipase L1-like esterase
MLRPMRRLRRLLPLLCVLTGVLVSPATAQTYSNNFDTGGESGVMVSGFTVNGANTTMGVYPYNAVSAPYALGGGSNATTFTCTSLTARADMTIQYTERVVQGDLAATSSVWVPIVRATSNGATFYELNINWGSPTFQMYAVGPGIGGGAGYAAIGNTVTVSGYTTGTVAVIKMECVGTTIHAKIWKLGQTEPGSWMWTATDTNITSAGYAGCYQSSNWPITPYIDDLNIAASGSTFATASATNVSIKSDGDSVTAGNNFGSGVPSYVANFSQDIAAAFPTVVPTVTNAAVSGQTEYQMLWGATGSPTSPGADGLDQEILSTNPDIVTLATGLNDSVEYANGTLPGNLRAYINKCLAHVNPSGLPVQVVLATDNFCGQNLGQTYVRPYATYYGIFNTILGVYAEYRNNANVHLAVPV